MSLSSGPEGSSSKKGDLTSCLNWRGITLISIVAKVFGRVLIKLLLTPDFVFAYLNLLVFLLSPLLVFSVRKKDF